MRPGVIHIYVDKFVITKGFSLFCGNTYRFFMIKYSLNKSSPDDHEQGNLLCRNSEPYTGTIRENTKYLIEERSYFQGKLHGVQKTFYKSGVLKKATMYTHGLENGRRIEYYECGSKKLNVNFTEGKEDGLYEEWDIIGNLKTRKTFYNGKLLVVKSCTRMTNG